MINDLELGQPSPEFAHGCSCPDGELKAWPRLPNAYASARCDGGMEVTDVEAVLLSHVYPDDEILRWSAGRIESWDAALVRVETDDGRVGWGEAGHALTGTEAVPGIVDALRDGVVGRDPANAARIARDLYDRNVFWARGGLPTGVIGAIEIALYDLHGQATGQPLYQLLGGPTEPTVRAYGSGGIAAAMETRVEQAVQYADAGFDTVKIRAVAEPMRNVELVERALDALPSEIDLALDAVQGSAGNPWPVKDAVRLGRALEPHADRLAWYEEPCRAEDLAGYQRVRDAVDIPVTGIETYTGLDEWRQAVAAGAVDMLQPDITIAGGLTMSRQISGLAASHELPLVLHVWGTGVSLLANAHFAAADPNTDLIEYCQLPNPLREELCPPDLTRDASQLSLPETPGLGVEMPAGFTDEYAFTPGKGHVFD